MTFEAAQDMLKKLKRFSLINCEDIFTHIVSAETNLNKIMSQKKMNTIQTTLDNYFEKNYILLESKFQQSIWAEFSNSLMRFHQN